MTDRCCFHNQLFMSFRTTPCTKKYTQQKVNPRFSYCATAMCGWRTYMEDAYIAKENIGNGCSLFGIFDGHGGCEVAHYVAKTFVNVLTSNQEFRNKNYEKSLIETYSQIDKMLKLQEAVLQLKSIRQQMKQPKGQYQQDDDVGSTAVVCLITEGQAFVANIGDSRCMASINGSYFELSSDHKPENQIELNRIKRAGGKVIQGRVNGDLNLSRAFGDFSYKSNPQLTEIQQQIISEPQIRSVSLQGVQYLILGCDGIFQRNTNEQITNLITAKAQSKQLKDVSEEILDHLLCPKAEFVRGKDNMTLIVVKLSN